MKDILEASASGRLEELLLEMRQDGRLIVQLPEVYAMIGVDQPKEYHAEGDVWTHTLAAIRHSKKTVAHQLAAMLHDVGKPLTRSIDDKGVIHFYSHDEIGMGIALEVLDRLGVDDEVRLLVSAAVRGHMEAYCLHKASIKSCRGFLNRYGLKTSEFILDVSDADEKGSTPPQDFVPKARAKLYKALDWKPKVVRKAVLSGDEVMAMLKLEPGPEVGKAMDELLRLEDRLVAEGMTLSRNFAEAWLLALRIYEIPQGGIK